MAFTLYDAIVPAYQQMLCALDSLLDKGKQHCTDTGMPDADLIDARLCEDMLPFCYQVKSAVVHSKGAIEGVRAGQFSPDMTTPPDTWDALKARVGEGRVFVDALTSEEINALEGRDMRFKMSAYEAPFTAENFLTSFSQPNFYFHVTTAYDILRHKGVPIGKKEYMGKMRIRR